jgi:hypothetical protein
MEVAHKGSLRGEAILTLIRPTNPCFSTALPLPIFRGPQLRRAETAGSW